MIKPFLMPQQESRAGVRRPGMMVLPQGVERHPVPGGAAAPYQFLRAIRLRCKMWKVCNPLKWCFLGPTNDRMPRCWGPRAGAAQRG